MGAKKSAKMKDVAARVSVSPSTVSVVLNNRGDEFRISHATQRRIRTVAKELGVVARSRGKEKSIAPESNLIAIFTPHNFDRGPTAKFFAGVNRYLRENHLAYQAVIFPFERGRLRDKAKFLSGSSFTGAILTALTDDDLEFVQATTFDLPIVLFNRILPHRFSVTTDEYTTGKHAMNHFLSHGRSRFAVIAPNYSSRSLSMRSIGFQDRFYSQSHSSEAAVILPVQIAEDNTEGGFCAMQACLRGGAVPDAVFVLHDHMVAGVMNAIQDHGLSVPGDIEIITIGESNINTLLKPTISSFSGPTEQMSYDCAMLLHTAIRDGVLSDNVNRSYIAELVCRESSPA